MRPSQSDVAKERVANERGPRPSPEPLVAGLYGAMAASASVIGFRFLVIPDPNPSWIATYIVTGLGFVLPFGVMWYRQRKYDDAVARVYLSLPDENGH